MKTYYVHIMTNKSGTLYVGVTNDLERRVSEHKQEMVEGFTKRYQVHRLVYIRDQNPHRLDLSENWFHEGPDPSLRSG